MNQQNVPLKNHTGLYELREIAQQMVEKLSTALEKEDDRYKPFLSEQIAALQKALADSETPDEYKVAVVGSFKVGKSSFVNALCGMKAMASVNTNPETAAISIFRYGEKPYAEIHMTAKEEWDKICSLYKSDPSHPEVERYRRVYDLEKSNKLKDEYHTSLSQLEEQYIVSPSFVKRISCTDWDSQEARKKFSRELKEYTSRRNPLHYLVDRLEVYVPISLLSQGVKLIDTPGLDDTDRYRVRLTENLVEDVDVILFLTPSGNSYSQSNKDFIISQLRKQKLKSLRMIVTKIDETFDNARKDAEDNDEEPPSFQQHLEHEENRLREQLRITLDEMLTESGLKDDEDATHYYISQLEKININFVSSDYYFKSDIEKSGIVKLRDDLKTMLAESERIAKAKNNLSETIKRIAERTLRTFNARLEATSHDFDTQQVHCKLGKIITAVDEKSSGLEKKILKQVKLLSEKISNEQELVEVKIEIMLSNAREVITNQFELEDIGKHWATRRAGNWGYLKDLQDKIANVVFPQMERILVKQNDIFKNLLDNVKKDLEKLQDDTASIEKKYAISETAQPISLTSVLATKSKSLLNECQDFLKYNKSDILRYLNKFVSNEVEEKIEEARRQVTNIRGTGTSNYQKEEVIIFYNTLKNSLEEELGNYLRKQVKKFSSLIETKAQDIYPEIKNEINIVNEDRIKAIKTNLVEMNEKQKEDLVGYLTCFLKEFEDIHQRLLSFQQVSN